MTSNEGTIKLKKNQLTRISCANKQQAHYYDMKMKETSSHRWMAKTFDYLKMRV